MECNGELHRKRLFGIMHLSNDVLRRRKACRFSYKKVAVSHFEGIKHAGRISENVKMKG